MDGTIHCVLLGEISDEGAAESGEVAAEGLGGIGGDEEEGAVVVGVFPRVFDGGAGFGDAAHAVDGALAFDDERPYGGEVLVEFGEELIGALEQESGEMKNWEFRMGRILNHLGVPHSQFALRLGPQAFRRSFVELGTEIMRSGAYLGRGSHTTESRSLY